ncbi:MAG: peptidoglycan editing factor PgeF, partial [Anaerolineae bacterium]
VIHAITTRHGGVSVGPYRSLNLTTGTGDDPAAVGENLARVAAALGLRRDDIVSPNQRHTANVRRVTEADRGQVYTGYDVFITDRSDVPMLLRYADCTPVLLYDPARHAAAVVHSGWRGTVQGATRAAVSALCREYGSRPADLIAGIGPSIGPCCYEVGDEVTDAVAATFDRPDELLPAPAGKARRHFDLWAANRRWLLEAGVRRIEIAELCTACRVDEFYSYRAERGKTGHFGAVMALRPRPGGVTDRR